MNNFITPETAATGGPADAAVPKHLERLVTEMFQGLFPPIAPQNTPLSTIRRVLLLNREPAKDDGSGSYVVNLRHYAITTKVTGLPKAIRRLNAAEKLITSREKKKKALPNLGNLEDIADYMLDPSGAGYTSASESEVETDAEVEVLASSARKIIDKRERQKRQAKEANGEASSAGADNIGVEKRAVKLIELGPRMRLRLVKVEDDLCTGKVLWHEFVTKTKAEEKQMDKVWDQRRKEKEERRRIQRENVERKKKEKAEKGGAAGEEDEDEDDEEDLDDYDMDDDVWHDDGDEDEEAEGGVAVDGGSSDEDEEMEDD